jgi:lipid A 3-O-deacylase
VIIFLFLFGALAASAAETITIATLPPTRLRFGSVTLYSENDKYFAGTDQHYTNGFKLSALSADLTNFTTDPVPRVVQRVARALDRLVPPGRDCKLGLALGQNLYTPTDIATSTPQPNDRPYAAWLYASAAFHVYQPPRVFATGLRAVARLDTLEVSAGLVGPGAFGRQVQNNVHALLGLAPTHGWPNQIHNEPGLDLALERKWRISTAHARDDWGADLIPHVGVTAGNIHTFASAGAELRAGWRLPADFGTNLIRPSSDSNSDRRPAWSLSAFIAGDGRAIARDITLDGNTFRASPHVDKKPFVGDALGGIAFGTRHWQITYAQALRTKEFKTQVKASVFGSISATLYY